MVPKETVLSSFGAVKLALFGGYEARWGLTRQSGRDLVLLRAQLEENFLEVFMLFCFGVFSDLSATGT